MSTHILQPHNLQQKYPVSSPSHPHQYRLFFPSHSLALNVDQPWETKHSHNRNTPPPPWLLSSAIIFQSTLLTAKLIRHQISTFTAAIPRTIPAPTMHARHWPLHCTPMSINRHNYPMSLSSVSPSPPTLLIETQWLTQLLEGLTLVTDCNRSWTVTIPFVAFCKDQLSVVGICSSMICCRSHGGNGVG